MGSVGKTVHGIVRVITYSGAPEAFAEWRRPHIDQERNQQEYECGVHQHGHILGDFRASSAAGVFAGENNETLI